MHIDFKETIWYRLMIPEKYEDHVLANLKNKNFKTANQVIDNLQQLDKKYDVNGEYLGETSEQVFVEENQYNPTIEVWNDKDTVLGDEIIWHNGPESDTVKDKILLIIMQRISEVNKCIIDRYQDCEIELPDDYDSGKFNHFAEKGLLEDSDNHAIDCTVLKELRALIWEIEKITP